MYLVSKKAIKNFLVITSLCFLISCQSNNAISHEQLLIEFRNSSEYSAYKKSDEYFSQALVFYRVEPLGFIISLSNSGEAKAFEAYIANNTAYHLKRT